MTFLRNCWQVAAYGWEGRPLMTRPIANEPHILFRTARGKLVAMEDRCPHRSVPLSQGTLLSEHIHCCYHGLRFDVGAVAGRRLLNAFIAAEARAAAA